jgi:hypothetical protein
MLLNLFLIPIFSEEIQIGVGLNWRQRGSSTPIPVPNDTTIVLPLSSYSSYAVAAEFSSRPPSTHTALRYSCDLYSSPSSPIMLYENIGWTDIFVHSFPGLNNIEETKHYCRFLFYAVQPEGKTDYSNANCIDDKTLNFYFDSRNSLFLITPDVAEDNPREGVVSESPPIDGVSLPVLLGISIGSVTLVALMVVLAVYGLRRKAKVSSSSGLIEDE